jgi:hypothetical protein
MRFSHRDGGTGEGDDEAQGPHRGRNSRDGQHRASPSDRLWAGPLFGGVAGGRSPPCSGALAPRLRRRTREPVGCASPARRARAGFARAALNIFPHDTLTPGAARLRDATVLPPERDVRVGLVGSDMHRQARFFGGWSPIPPWSRRKNPDDSADVAVDRDLGFPQGAPTVTS